MMGLTLCPAGIARGLEFFDSGFKCDDKLEVFVGKSRILVKRGRFGVFGDDSRWRECGVLLGLRGQDIGSAIQTAHRQKLAVSEATSFSRNKMSSTRLRKNISLSLITRSKDLSPEAGNSEQLAVDDYAEPVLHSGDRKHSAETVISTKISGKERRTHVVDELRSGRSPFDILNSMREWSPPEFWAVVDYLHVHERMAEVLEVFEWWKEQDGYRPCELHYTKFIRMLGRARMPMEARRLFIEMCTLGLRPSVVTYTCLLQCYAERGHFEEADTILKDMILSGDAKPNNVTYTGLIHAYGKHGMYDDMWRTFNNMKTVGIAPDEFTYRTLIKAYARGGLFNRMQSTIKEMSRNDMYPDSATMNAVVQAYADAGLVKEMEKHYEILTMYSFIAGRATIKAMVWTYARNSLFFQLSRFVKRVGMNRRTVGNYLWNALLLSRAANFAMSHLRAEFENMKYAGFIPDVTSCNIMALAYSRMQQFWELHSLIITMQNNGIAPDLVTYGAVIDVFIEEKLRPKLLEELVEFRNLDVVAEVDTDPLVFEIFGKGKFHVACDALVRNMQGAGATQQTYAELIGYYLQSLSKPDNRARRRVLL